MEVIVSLHTHSSTDPWWEDSANFKGTTCKLSRPKRSLLTLGMWAFHRPCIVFEHLAHVYTSVYQSFHSFRDFTHISLLGTVLDNYPWELNSTKQEQGVLAEDM